ncbi:MAG: hypothetical protein P0S95_06880 [Rhabdochlamydiaceae bacterium]|nr:hypothetical protein [Candidatus Amphrikana amoebophyrae]
MKDVPNAQLTEMFAQYQVAFKAKDVTALNSLAARAMAAKNESGDEFHALAMDITLVVKRLLPSLR